MTSPLGFLARMAPQSLVAVARDVGGNLRAYARARTALRGADRVGREARCFGRVHLDNRGLIRIGDDFALGGSLAPVQIAADSGGMIGIGDSVRIEYGTSISARSLVSIGHRVRIGPYSVLSDADLPLPLLLADDCDPRGIMVGDDVWIGARVTLMPGVRIGARAVIAAGSVVTSDVADDALAAGSPATVLRVAPRHGEGTHSRA